jgi:transcriptional regulator with XRE-family HTH domain
MGQKPRNRPKNLPRKLLQIRKTLGLSQSEMLRRMGVEDWFTTARISEYEAGIREPSLWMLLAYGRVARIHLETLIDDNATLPDKLPGNFNYRRSKQTLAATGHESGDTLEQ